MQMQPLRAVMQSFLVSLWMQTFFASLTVGRNPVLHLSEVKATYFCILERCPIKLSLKYVTPCHDLSVTPSHARSTPKG
jgi:hypothetical protein